MITIEEHTVRYRAKKNTRQWCKGKEGRPHDYQIDVVEWQINHLSNPLRKLYKVWTRCIHCKRKGEYVAIYDKDDEWTIRKSRFTSEEKRARFQRMLDEVAQRIKGDATPGGTDSDGASRENRH